ncbi:hypothetical protein F0U44_21620 [Nocardioides humilatus]|uniref:Uncharacterized protein n=1 Tax=Nocardioides humilatus TaxID=2607660 RepID=A0A5B1L3R7_9ACTN|nr:hypothetical protein [Nocardioides humilatus]KAA1415293.1 hypothetical protein F0U44_21620 [Nocardioides humilatus]
MSPRLWLRGVVVVAVAATTLGLAGCGGKDDDDPYAIPERFQDYCDEVTSLQAAIGDALSTGGDTTGLIKALPSFKILAAEAPGDISEDWDLVIERIEDLVDALDGAGIDPETYDRKHPPQGLTEAQRGTIDAAALALVSTATSQAMSSVQQQARDVCKTPLAL